MDALFPKGHVLLSEDVLERGGFIREVSLRLVAGDRVMPAGPRRIGKTSVAFEILRRLAADGYYVLHLDLSHVISVTAFAIQLMSRVMSLRTGPIQKFSDTIHELVHTLQHAEIALKIHDLEIHTHLNPSSPDAYQVIDAALSSLETIAHKEGRRAVILLDEFQEIERLGGTMLLKRMRSIMQQQQSTSYLFLGSEPFLLQTLFADRRQAFYRFATMLHLPPIPHAEWVSYITKKFAGVDMTITDDAIRLLLDKTGGHPFCVMVALGESYFQSTVNHNKTVDILGVYEGLSEAALTLEPIYEESLEANSIGTRWRFGHTTSGYEPPAVPRCGSHCSTAGPYQITKSLDPGKTGKRPVPLCGTYVPAMDNPQHRRQMIVNPSRDLAPGESKAIR